MVEKTIAMTANIIPVAQMRARHAAIGGFSRTYKDKKQADNEQALMTLLAKYQPKDPLKGAVKLTVEAYMPIPESKPVKWKQAAMEKIIQHTTKPDLDNLVKHVKDVLTMMRFWDDDKQVVKIDAVKCYSNRPRWEIVIEEF